MKSIFHENLNEVWLHRNNISSVGSYAFYSLPNLTYVSLYKNPINGIQPFAFAMPPSEEILIIDLGYEDSEFESEAFMLLSLTKIRRPAIIKLGSSNLKTLKKEIFTSYFNDHPNHKIEWRNYGGLNCDCDMSWLLENGFEFKDRFLGDPVLCEQSGLEIWDLKSENFNCVTTSKIELNNRNDVSNCSNIENGEFNVTDNDVISDQTRI